MENTIKYIINENIGIKFPIEMKSMAFQGFFTYLRKSLQIKYTRKIHIDSILKKCKGKFFKAVNDCLKKCVKINIKKLPQTYITNISIEYNRQFLNFTINDLYTHFNLIPYSMDTILEKDYCIKDKEVYFKYIFLSKIDNLYLLYIKSSRYKKEMKLLKKHKGEKISFLHQFVAENFINYYYFSKPHIKKNNCPKNNLNYINYNDNEKDNVEKKISLRKIENKNEIQKNYFTFKSIETKENNKHFFNIIKSIS